MMSHRRRALRSHCFVFALTLACGILFAQKCQAQDFTWNLSSTGAWENPSNWTPNGVPGLLSATDTATITMGTALFTTNRTIQSLTLGSFVDIAGGATL